MVSRKPSSAFQEQGLEQSVAHLLAEIRELYLSDEIPWVVGYSGGKDSTAVLQLVWNAIADLPPERRVKPIHVISTDTLVENPIVAMWVAESLVRIRCAASEQDLPIQAHRLTPEIRDTFWVNLIGKGYPAPRPMFRWCTLRLKITPSNNFIANVVRENGETILALGTRRAESSRRAHNMKKYAQMRVRDLLSPNASLPNSLVYTPIESWTNDDVWLFLMQTKSPWGIRNKDLLTMYQGASEDGECPLVVDTTTPSCGDSRFGCWVCTLVDKDRSMQAMIQNDSDKEWMLPLLELRDELGVTDDRPLRDFRRLNGRVMLHNDRLVHGPYRQDVRATWLRKVLLAQQHLRVYGPPAVHDAELITMEELHEIRRMWVAEKHEREDLLPGIYEEVTGQRYEGSDLTSSVCLGADELALLEAECENDRLHYEMVRDLLDTGQQFETMAKRKGLFGALEKVIQRSFYTDADDALDYARRKKAARTQEAPGHDPSQQGLVLDSAQDEVPRVVEEEA